VSIEKTFGPYELEQDTYSEPMPRTVRQLYSIPGYIHSGDPERHIHRTVFAALTDALRAAGVELGTYDRRIVAWLAGWEPSAVQVLIGLITRAHAAGGGPDA
jgi:hypothetical protein